MICFFVRKHAIFVNFTVSLSTTELKFFLWRLVQPTAIYGMPVHWHVTSEQVGKEKHLFFSLKDACAR
jgi:hypothetical protein